jgi:hypothetical protein
MKKQEQEPLMSMEPEKIQAYALEVATELGETEEGPLRQITLLVEHAGEEFVKAALEETRKIEEGEGIKTEDGLRRRTKGGVFFYITKGKLSPEVRQIVYPTFGILKNKALEWEERGSHIAEMLEQPAGDSSFLNITIHGTPGHVIKYYNTVMVSLSNRPSAINLAKGIPQPPEEDSRYIVYMGLRQWEAVEESLAKSKNDRLIVEGGLHFDKETGTLAIFARSVTTRNMAKNARKEAQPRQEAPAKGKDKKAPRKQAESERPAPSLAPVPPDPEENVPMGMREKLTQLYSAAETLRERIQSMEKKGQAGVAMTKKLLQTTEAQIEALEKQFGK